VWNQETRASAAPGRKECAPEERLESLRLREKGFETSRLEEMKC
jgi:hypothetical protein